MPDTTPLAIEKLLNRLPATPGVYLMKDDAGHILYVGKASSLRQRVRSYFQPGQAHSPRIEAMVRRVAHIDWLVTAGEVEALVLEANLIKEHRPRYNVMLRDDKKYPFLKFTQERFPQLIEVRDTSPDGARYFGPYTNAGAMRRVDRLIRHLFRIRRCTYDLHGGRQMRPCLDYHIGLCDAPCAGLIDAEEYNRLCDQAAAFLQGRQDEIVKRLREEMREASAQLDFERAAELRDLLADIELLSAQQRIVSATHFSADILAVAQHQDLSCVEVLFVRKGKVLGDNHAILEGTHRDVAGVPLRAFITDYYERGHDIPPQLLLSSPIDDPDAVAAWLSEQAGRRVEVLVPERGDKRQLIDLARANADECLRQYMADRDRQRQRSEAAVVDLRERLELPRTPFRIECYDIATLHGNENVGSMVVFEDGRPARSAYRKFKIRGEADAPNDYAMMREVLSRRLQKAIEGDEKFLPLPDLLLVDGGKGQLGVAVAVCDELGFQQIPLASLAKQHEHVFLPERPDAVIMDARAPALRLLRSIRDEAHRVANTYHQRLRRKATVRSLLDDIPGVGKKRRTLLLEHFRSTDAIRAASVDEIAALPGMNRPVAEKVKAWLTGGDALQEPDADAPPPAAENGGADG